VWEETNRRRKAATERKRSGQPLDAADHALTRFTMHELFADPKVRVRLLITFLMSLTTTLAWWGISTFVPIYVGIVASKASLPAQAWQAYAGMTSNIGAIIGYISLGFLADIYGRKPIALIFFVLSLVMTPVLFLWTHDLTLLLVVAGLNGLF